ncbi:ATP-binding protein [Candidatus Poriferisocius sp.]|uniref:ATP-binding protein n=1 Tax=Candidatus Poriferisocius sp. TaxID=3101276 RepID=UPI003B02C7B4
MYERSLSLPEAGAETFFLWGPRQAGKSTLLKQRYPDAIWVDLLKSEEYRRYAVRPEMLRQELEAMAPGASRSIPGEQSRGESACTAPGASRPMPGEQFRGEFAFTAPGASRQVVIDEIQKVPALLDEVHWLIENRGLRFALCGSSARKVRHGAANLLGGRALRYELRGLTAGEIGQDFDLDRALNHGYLPRIYESAQPRRLLNAYIADYLRQEVAAEGLVRNLPAFSDFLDAAALSDGDPVNHANIARECGVSATTVKAYFGILTDTLLARWLPRWQRRMKRRLAGAPKLYFEDVGVVNRLARRGELLRGSDAYGKAFENWVFHELSAFVSYREIDDELTYWRLASGIEVDFVVGDLRLAIEAKATARVTSSHLKGLRALAAEHPGLGRRVVVCIEPRPRRTDEGIDILPATDFARHLWQGHLI